MTAVPEAGALHSQPETPVRAAIAARSSSSKPSGKVGKARSSGTPAISQCPVVVSLPALASLIFPKAASGESVAGKAWTPSMLPEAERAQARRVRNAPAASQM